MNRIYFTNLIFLFFIVFGTVSCSTSTNDKIDATANETVDWVSQQFSNAGDWISNQYSNLLNNDDQDKLTASTKQAAATGEDQIWTSDDGDVKASIKVIKTESEKGDVSVKVPSGRLEKIPPLEMNGAPYRTLKNANVRSGPGTDFAVVDKINQDTVVVVIGKVQDKPWYLVGDGAVANGFIFEKLLEAIPDSENKMLAVAKLGNNSGIVQEEKVETEWLCRTIQQTINLADGKTQVEEVRACQGLDGWEIK
ncbi:MAG: SH3 domain-containing protein [Sneathiella sp.]|uniref:SH3 domain-containing protein n=1 Tax=Sneathiella sp. TaxID=1964365 RepID=UPI0030025CFC